MQGLTPRELLEAALKTVDGDEFELGHMLGISPQSTQRTFAKWRSGVGPKFETTIRLLEIAGLLKPQG